MKNILLLLFIISFTEVYSQLEVTENLTPTEYASYLVGSGVSVSNATYTGDPRAIGKFVMNGSSNLELNSGVILTTGRAIGAIGPNDVEKYTSPNNGGSDPQLALLITEKTTNAAVLEFDFIPSLGIIKLTYVFASEEYPEYSQGKFFDVIGLFITGNNPNGNDYLHHNIALIPGTNTPVGVNTINNGPKEQGPCINCSYYINNGGNITIQYDGLTTAITAFTNVTPGESYHFKIAIADAYDGGFDSGIFLKAGSFRSSLSNTITKVVKCNGDTCFWHNNSYTVEGSYYDTLQSYKGYDSICQLDLVVNPSYLIKESIKKCNNESYFWHEKNRSTSGLYYDSLQTINGCDSVYELKLTISSNYKKNIFETICEGDSVEWQGHWYSEKGFFEKKLIRDNGCDSILQLNLVVNPSYLIKESVVVCTSKSYFWHGKNRSISGLYYDSLQTINGCDSIFKLKLAISLQITQDLIVSEYVSQILGSGVQVSNATYTGDPIAIGKFVMNGSSKLQLDSGVLLTTGKAINAAGSAYLRASSSNTGGSDPILASLTTAQIHDAAVLEFDFIPLLDTIKLTYVFASEEYPEYSGDKFNDVIGMFITGDNPNGIDYLNHNIALIPGTNTPVNINTINNGKKNRGPCMHCSYYIANYTSTYIVYDGLTTAITAFAKVTPNTSYHFKIAIADVYDGILDSGIFLKAGSFKSELPKTITKVVKCKGDTCFWHNNSYTVEGSYYDTLQSYKGYDSICQLDLVVNPSYLIKDSIKICNKEAYFWHGENRSVSGLYYDSLQTINGCDSVYELKLTLSFNYKKNIFETICEGDSVEWQGHWYSEKGVFEKKLIRNNGCDSILQLNLVVNPSYLIKESVVVCTSKSYFWHGKNRSISGLYYDSLQTINGCDSIYELKLTFSQLQIIQNLTPSEYVNQILGDGVAVSNVIYTGDPLSIGQFTMSDNSFLELDSGVLLTTGNVINAASSNLLLSSLPSSKIHDATVLEFDFIPQYDTIKLTFVFASEEYSKYINSSNNDIFGLFITGNNPNGTDYLNQNIAFIPETSIPVSINTINNGKTNTGPCVNCSYYKNNIGKATIQYDGLTTSITAFANVIPGKSYHFKIAITDGLDSGDDSGLFIKAGSFRSTDLDIGINQNAKNELSFELYPNPNNGSFTLDINSSNIKPNQKFNIEIYNTVGKLVYQEEVKAYMSLQKSINVEGLSKGIYFIRIHANDAVLNSKFVLE